MNDILGTVAVDDVMADVVLVPDGAVEDMEAIGMTEGRFLIAISQSYYQRVVRSSPDPYGPYGLATLALKAALGFLRKRL